MIWLHPQIYRGQTAPHLVMMTDKSREICAEGPARTSKTLRNLRKLLASTLPIQRFHVVHCSGPTASIWTTLSGMTSETRLLKYQLDDHTLTD